MLLNVQLITIFELDYHSQIGILTGGMFQRSYKNRSYPLHNWSSIFLYFAHWSIFHLSPCSAYLEPMVQPLQEHRSSPAKSQLPCFSNDFPSIFTLLLQQKDRGPSKSIFLPYTKSEVEYAVQQVNRVPIHLMKHHLETLNSYSPPSIQPITQKFTYLTYMNIENHMFDLQASLQLTW